MIISDDLTLHAQVAAHPHYFIVMRDYRSRVISLCMHAGCYQQWIEGPTFDSRFWRSCADMAYSGIEVSLVFTPPVDVSGYSSFNGSDQNCRCTRCKQVEYHGPPAPQR